MQESVVDLLLQRAWVGPESFSVKANQAQPRVGPGLPPTCARTASRAATHSSPPLLPLPLPHRPQAVQGRWPAAPRRGRRVGGRRAPATARGRRPQRARRVGPAAVLGGRVQARRRRGSAAARWGRPKQTVAAGHDTAGDGSGHRWVGGLQGASQGWVTGTGSRRGRAQRRRCMGHHAILGALQHRGDCVLSTSRLRLRVEPPSCLPSRTP